MEEDRMILRIPESTTKKLLKKGMKEMERVSLFSLPTCACDGQNLQCTLLSS